MSEETKIIEVGAWVYEKVKKLDIAIHIPQTPIYFQEQNHRAIIGIFPNFAFWSDNSVCGLQIIKITNNIILKSYMSVLKIELSDQLNRIDIKGKSQEEYLQDSVLNYLKDFYTQDRVSKEIFVDRYNQYIQKIAEIANL
jgi:hypothetical protein